MTKGFFTIAQGEEYVRFAYAMALSLKISQKENSNLSIGITPGHKVKDKYKSVFDQIVEIPWGDAAAGSSWKLENEWKAIYMTPYDETIKLDADMLFPSDISHWWDMLGESKIAFATEVSTYRNELVESDYYRKVFTKNNLPNVYSAFMYFKKCDESFEFFKLVELIYNNWESFFFEFLEPEERPNYVSTDVVFAIAAKILNIEELFKYRHIKQFPTFVHMKTQLQKWSSSDSNRIPEEWNKAVHPFFDLDCNLMIGNYRQTLPFHYHLKDFVTDEMITIMERKLGL